MKCCTDHPLNDPPAFPFKESEKKNKSEALRWLEGRRDWAVKKNPDSETTKGLQKDYEATEADYNSIKDAKATHANKLEELCAREKKAGMSNNKNTRMD